MLVCQHFGGDHDRGLAAMRDGQQHGVLGDDRFDARVALSWTDNSNNETGFEVEVALDGIAGTYNLLILTAADATMHLDENLAPSTEHCYRVRAVNAVSAPKVASGAE